MSTLDFYLVLINRHEKKSGNREEDGCDQNTLLPFRMDDLRRDFGSIYKGITKAHCFGHLWFYPYQLGNLKQIHCAVFCLCVGGRVLDIPSALLQIYTVPEEAVSGAKTEGVLL